MSAQILDLSAPLRRAQQIEGCTRCANHGGRCGPHQVADVARRLRDHRDDAAAEMLIASSDVVDVITEALEALDLVLDGSLRPHERNVR